MLVLRSSASPARVGQVTHEFGVRQGVGRDDRRKVFYPASFRKACTETYMLGIRSGELPHVRPDQALQLSVHDGVLKIETRAKRPEELALMSGQGRSSMAQDTLRDVPP